MLRRSLRHFAIMSGAFALSGRLPLHRLSPPAPEPVDGALSVTA